MHIFLARYEDQHRNIHGFECRHHKYDTDEVFGI